MADPIVRIDYDLPVDLRFFAGRLPNALKLEIDRQKQSILQSLQPRPEYWYLLAAVQIFSVNGRSFQVSFALDRTRNNPQSGVLTIGVTFIQEI